jgi:hypothetical protein
MKYNLSEQGLANIKKGIREKSIIKLKSKFPDLKHEIEPYDSHNYIIKIDNKFIKIPIDKFIKKYNIDNRLYSEKKIDEYFCNLELSEKQILDNINIANTNLSHPKQNQESYIKFYYPDVYKSILLWTENYDINFKERIFLFKNGLKSKPTCICCNNEVEFSASKKFYNTYCKDHINSHHTSGKEQDLFNFISFNYSKIVSNFKLPQNIEIDVYIPDLKIGFEFNGLYWHSDEYKKESYHYDKWIAANWENIQLINIWEDDWDNKQKIVKSIILNKLNKTSNKIFARKTEIKKVNYKEVKIFLENNHIQGWSQSSLNFGLYYNKELVSLMTFGKKRKILNSISKEDQYELIRFCNKLNTSVIGGASKLFKHFIKNYSPKEIVSYANLDISDGALYETLDFINKGHTGVNYWWVKDRRYHRSNFMKHKLVKEGEDPRKTADQIMRDRGYKKIYGTGNLKFIWKDKILDT